MLAHKIWFSSFIDARTPIVIQLLHYVVNYRKISKHNFIKRVSTKIKYGRGVIKHFFNEYKTFATNVIGAIALRFLFTCLIIINLICE